MRSQELTQSARAELKQLECPLEQVSGVGHSRN